MIEGVIAVIVLAAVAIELLVPGANVYHSGWYNVALVGLAIVLALRLRNVIPRARTARARIALALAGLGVAAVAFAGIGFGLFAPDPQTVVGAPGATIEVEGVALHFPLLQEGTPSRSLRGAFLLDPQPRTVVSVDVADAAGHHLTTTQPTGASFLSPVLLMQLTQSLGGFDLPYDTFAVPAAHRIVKAVLLTPEAIAHMPALAGTNTIVLFDVEDEREVQVAHGLGVARDGIATEIGGLRLQASRLSYPAMRLIALPNPLVVVPGLIAALAGMIVFALDLRRGREVA